MMKQIITREVMIEVLPSQKWNREKQCYEPEPAHLVTVNVTVNFSDIALRLANKAARSKGKRARYMKGAVDIKVISDVPADSQGA